jgi:hypothetical protein
MVYVFLIAGLALAVSVVIVAAALHGGGPDHRVWSDYKDT